VMMTLLPARSLDTGTSQTPHYVHLADSFPFVLLRASAGFARPPAYWLPFVPLVTFGFRLELRLTGSAALRLTNLNLGAMLRGDCWARRAPKLQTARLK